MTGTLSVEGTSRPHYLGRLALGFLAVTIVSGVLIVPVYQVAHPLWSIERLNSVVPLGWLWRSLHYYSAALLLITTVAHLAEVAVLKSEQTLPRATWQLTLLTLPALLLAMLGGYILTGTQEGIGAGDILGRTMEYLPLVGQSLNTFIGNNQTLSTVAIHHGATFTIALFFFTLLHLKRGVVDIHATVLAALATLIIAAFVPVGLETPPNAPAPDQLLGPWYLMGVQKWVTVLPQWTTLLWLPLLMVPLALLPTTPPKWRTALWAFALTLLLTLEIPGLLYLVS